MGNKNSKNKYTEISTNAKYTDDVDREELLDVGRVVNTHGHRGEVKVIPLTDYPGRLKEIDNMFFGLGNKIRKLTVKSVKFHKNFAIMGFNEVEDMNAAESLKNGFLKITKDQLRELPEDNYYIFDILGLEVFTDTGEYLGEISDVLQTGANDVYEVKNHKLGKTYLIPAIKQIVKSVDLKTKEMIIMPMEGLLD